MAGNPDNNLNPTGKAYVGVVVLPELSISKTGPTEVEEGDLATYTITISFEDAVATNVVVNDTKTWGMLYDSSTPAGTRDRKVTTWNLGDVDPAITSEITITLTLIADVTGSQPNRVSVTCDEGVYAEDAVDTLVTASP